MNLYTRNQQRSRRHSHYEESRSAITFQPILELLQYLARSTLTPITRLYRFIWYTVDKPRDGRRIATNWLVRNVFTFVNLFIVIWFWILFWGESSVFSRSIDACNWDNWERWPQTASPHHLALVADPQLVDPHTYPGRPWPLSTLTVKHTDIYLRRSYSRLQRELRPDTIFFLGDLFDGGREWNTSLSQSPESQYWIYGEEYWHREHDRFSSIFLRDWSGGQNHPQIIASLPGNHDLGFGTGIQEPVRARFTAFFGESNRIDIIGNHTFVSLDSVSLSAKDEETTKDTSAIWRPSEDFLNTVETDIAAAVDRHLNLTDVYKTKKYTHTALDLKDPSYNNHPKTVHSSAHTSFPLILLTHVPLYRPPGTPCGPLRERYPPTPPPPGETNPVEPDERNAISISHGWQYQNVVSRALSLFISEKLGGAIDYAFSGDDHDYCELVHKGYPSTSGGIKEITVKSISWAMGVRKPGFLMVSLYNPIDESGSQIPWSEDSLEGGEHFETRRTLQTHLCLLPDQLAIFIRYAVFFGVTVAAFLLRAVALTISLPGPKLTNYPLLSTFGPASRVRRSSRSVSSGDDIHPRSPPRRRHSSVSEYQPPSRDAIISHSSRSSRENLTSSASATLLSSRTTNRAQSRDRNQGYAMTNMENGYGEAEGDVRGEWQARSRRVHGPVASFFVEWLGSLWLVARVVFLWYFWLQWR